MIHLKGSSSSKLALQLDDEQIQPNAIDLKVKKVFTRKLGQPQFVLSCNKENMNTMEYYECLCSPKFELDGKNGWWLSSSSCYLLEMYGTITIADDEAGFVLPRSTLIRNNAFLMTGLYDSGYQGPMTHTLFLSQYSSMILERGARVGQLILFKAEALKKYDGQYQKA